MGARSPGNRESSAGKGGTPGHAETLAREAAAGTLTRDGDDALRLYGVAALVDEHVGEKPRGEIG